MLLQSLGLKGFRQTMNCYMFTHPHGEHGSRSKAHDESWFVGLRVRGRLGLDLLQRP